jgi:hypothetical protein
MSKKTVSASELKDMTHEERANALIAAEYGDAGDEEDEAPTPGLMESLGMKKAPVSGVDADLMAFMNTEDPVAPSDKQSLIPDLLSVFPNAQTLSVDLKRALGDAVQAFIPEPKMRVKKVDEPDDIYSGDRLKKRGDHLKIAMFYLYPVLGEEAIVRLFQVAKCRGVDVVDLLRQEIWHMVRQGRFKLDGVPEDRKPAHDNEGEINNRRLIELLEFSVFDVLQDKGRGANCSAQNAFVYGVKNGLEGWQL